MIDTFAFGLQPGRYKITKPHYFWPSLDVLNNNDRGDERKYPRNYYGNYKGIKDIYYPQVWMFLDTTSSPRKKVLVVECSLGKFMQGNNLFSLRQEALGHFAAKMVLVLRQMGVETSKRAIKEAMLRKLHPAHNMQTDYPVSMINDDLQRGIVARNMDVHRGGFRNGGDILHYHLATRELVLYDKVKDMERLQHSPKRAVCVDKFPEDENAYKQYLDGKIINVLRIEHRMNDQTEIRETFIAAAKNKRERKQYKKYGVSVQDAFNDRIIRDILLNELSKVETAVFQLPAYRRSVQDYYMDIKNNNPDKSYLEIQRLLPTVQMLAEKGGKSTLAFYRSLLGSEDKAQRLIAEAKSLNLKKHSPNYLKEIEEKLNMFESLTKESLTTTVNNSTLKLSMKNDNFEFRTVPEVAKTLRCKTITVQRYIRAGKLTAYKFGKEYRIMPQDLKAFILGRKVKKGGK